MRLLVLLSLMLLPQLAAAAVRISEVAWMGTAVAPADEWIELHNDGSAQSLEGWTLTGSNGLSIALSGTIGAGAYVVLERTDDTSAPGTAFLIYTGELPNGGATLTLRDGSGTAMDTVVGGDGWENIGGNNETKDTAQRSGNSWITAVATPGSGPGTPTTSSSSTTTTTTKKTTSSGGRLATPVEREARVYKVEGRELYTSIIGPEIGYVNQPVAFHASSSGLGETALHSLEHTWNFGDLTMGKGKEVAHRYSAPGTYVVYLDTHFKTFHAYDKYIVEVRSMPLSVARIGSLVTLTNTADYEIDISGFSVKGKSELAIPPRTFLLPGESLRIPLSKLAATGSDLIAVFDSAGAAVASVAPAGAAAAQPSPLLATNPLPLTTQPLAAASATTKPETDSSASATMTALLTPSTLAAALLTAPLPIPTAQADNTPSEQPQATQSPQSYLLLLLIITIGIVGVLSVGKKAD